MIGSKRSLLFFEDDIDLGHLRLTLERYELDGVFCRDIEAFTELSEKEQYDLIILSSIGNGDKRFDTIKSLGLTKNSDTPILLVVDNNSIPQIEDLMVQHLGIICFPFNPDEFIFRVFHILRSTETEITIHSNLQSYKNLINILPVGIIQTDDHGKFIRTNSWFLSMIGMNESDLFRENFFQLCHPDDYFLERKQLDRLLKKEIESIEYEIRLINNEGKTIVCSVAASIMWAGKDIFDSFAFIVKLISS